MGQDPSFPASGGAQQQWEWDPEAASWECVLAQPGSPVSSQTKNKEEEDNGGDSENSSTRAAHYR